MPRNDLQSLPPLELVAFNQNLSASLTLAYSVPTVQKDSLDDATENLLTCNAIVKTTEGAYRAAIRDREIAKKDAVSAVAQVARTIYANPGVTPGMVAAVGLSPRSTSRAKGVPVTPARLVATPQIDGSVRLEWDRMGNPAGVNFLVETQSGTGEWAFLGGTTATKTTLAGYAPGVPVSFRIVASKNGLSSTPSDATTIYAVIPTPALRLAA